MCQRRVSPSDAKVGASSTLCLNRSDGRSRDTRVPCVRISYAGTDFDCLCVMGCEGHIDITVRSHVLRVHVDDAVVTEFFRPNRLIGSCEITGRSVIRAPATHSPEFDHHCYSPFASLWHECSVFGTFLRDVEARAARLFRCCDRCKWAANKAAESPAK